MPSIKKFSFKKSHKHLNSDINLSLCTIHLLDENQPSLVINLKNNLLGSTLLDEVALQIGKLIEKDYFGLRYIDKHDQKHWLKLDKTVIKQLKKAGTNDLYFLIKYYPSDPLIDLVEDLARYQLYLQLRQDLYSEYLIVNDDLLPKLISLVIQAEVGDMPTPTAENILISINILKIYKNVNANIVQRVCDFVETLNGSDTSKMETQFVQLVSQLESYGVEPHSVLDMTNGGIVFLAMNHQGICTFVGDKRTAIYYWENISKMMCISKIFIIETNIDNKKRKLNFKFNTDNAAKAFWIWAMDRQYFMTLNASSDAKYVKSNNSVFRKKISHKFSGRSKKEVTESCQTLSSIPQRPIIRTRNPVMISRANSAKAVCRDSMIVENEEKSNHCSTLPRRSKSTKPISVVSIDFQADKDEEDLSINSSINDYSGLNTDDHKSESLNEMVLKESDEDEIIEVVEPVTFADLESATISSQIEELAEDIEIGSMIMENEIRERHTESLFLDRKTNEQPLDCKGSNDLSSEFPGLETDFQYPQTDGMFFVKFVVITTLILLVVMITSLVGYYYYRSATIADLKKQKYSSEWNKNIDLEAIKRFVLRHDAP